MLKNVREWLDFSQESYEMKRSKTPMAKQINFCLTIDYQFANAK